MAMHDCTQCEIGYGELPRSRRKQQLSTLNARHFLQQRQCLIAQRDSVLYARFHALLWDSKNSSATASNVCATDLDSAATNARAGPLAAAPHPARGAQRGAFLGPRLAPGLGLRPRSTLGQCRGVCHRRDYFTYLKNNSLTTLRDNLRQLQSRPMCGFAFEGRSFTQPFRCASGCACTGQGLANI